MNVLDRAALIENEFVIPGRSTESPLIQRITHANDTQRMPPLGEARLTADEIQTIARWIDSGAPEFPDDVPPPAGAEITSESHVYQAILDHLAELPVAERPFQRYFTATHLLMEGATRDELDVQFDALAKTVNHLSRAEKVVIPVAIDLPYRTVFAIDLRRLGWSDVVVSNGTTTVGLNRFDLCLLEYPYGSHANSTLFPRLLREYLQPARLVRPVSSIRIDWFVSTATLAPLYEDILALPTSIAELEAELGVDAAGNVQQANARRSGLAVSGVSRTIRAIEWHKTEWGDYWKSFDFRGSAGGQNFFRDPVHLRPDGGEMIFTLPNGSLGYFVTDAGGTRIGEAPTSIVTDRLASDAVVRNALSCIRCHSAGPKSFTDIVRRSLEQLAPQTAFDLQQALRLYVPQAVMEETVVAARTQFLAAMSQLQPTSRHEEPITPVARRYLDAPLHLATAAAELGIRDLRLLTEGLKTNRFVELGLAPLAAGGVVRRDLWEAAFPILIAEFGLGTPVTPVDGLLHSQFRTAGPSLILETNRSTNVFAPGDELVITVRNPSSQDQFMELWGADLHGRVAQLGGSPARIPAQGQIRFPSTGAIEVRGLKGRESITLFSAATEFPGGQLLKGKNIRDRVLHDFFPVTGDTDPRSVGINKQQLIIETR